MDSNALKPPVSESDKMEASAKYLPFNKRRVVFMDSSPLLNNASSSQGTDSVAQDANAKADMSCLPAASLTVADLHQSESNDSKLDCFIQDNGAQNNKKRLGSSTGEERQNKKSKKSVDPTICSENITLLGEHLENASQEVAASVNKDACDEKKKKKRVWTKERKAKKKIKDRIKRAETRLKLGVKRLKLQPVVKETKISYCRQYMNGRCHEGEKCKFSHDTTPLTKSKPCCRFARHACMKGDDCPFDHELSKYPCNNYRTTGSCNRGSACMFSHETQPSEGSVNESNKSKPEQKPLSNSGSKKVETNSCSVPKFVDITPKSTHPPKGINFLSQEKLPLVSRPPKGISFLSQEKLTLESRLSPKVDSEVKEITKTPPLFQDSKEKTKVPPVVHDSEDITKTPTVVPRGINFMLFGKKHGLDYSNRGYSLRISNRVEKSMLRIDLDSSPEPLRTKAVKRKQPEGGAAAQPVKKIGRKKISKRGNLDALAVKLSPERPVPSARAEPLSVFNDDLPPSPPRVSIREQLEGTKTAETEVEKAVEVKKPVEVELELEKTMEVETVDVSATKPKSPEVVAHGPGKGKSILEEGVPVITVSSSAANSAPPRDDIEENPVNVDERFIAQDEENSPIRLDETLEDYYYRTYSEKRASEIHAPFSDWQIYRDWLQGIFPPAEVKFQKERSHDHTYRSYLEETASSTSTTHRIVRELRNMHKEWDAFEASKKEVAEEKAKVAALRAKLDADQAEFESEQKTEEWSAAGWKRKAESEAALLSEERKRWREICDKDNNEKMVLRNNINNLKAEIEKLKKERAEAEAARDEARSHREMCEQREVQTCATLALRNKEIEELTSLLSDQEQTKAELESVKKDLQLERVEKAEAARRLTETEGKLESSETARATTESLVELLKNDMLWMRHHGIINVCQPPVANSILNSIDLDQTVANVMVTARNDGYTQGYAECTQHVNDALRVDWDNSRSATRRVDTGAAHAAAKAEYNNLRLPVMDLVTTALQSDDFVAQLKDILPDETDASDDEDLE
ncbi:putative transcription factor C3H family [Helianthus anomalus]